MEPTRFRIRRKSREVDGMKLWSRVYTRRCRKRADDLSDAADAILHGVLYGARGSDVRLGYDEAGCPAAYSPDDTAVSKRLALSRVRWGLRATAVLGREFDRIAALLRTWLKDAEKPINKGSKRGQPVERTTH